MKTVVNIDEHLTDHNCKSWLNLQSNTSQKKRDLGKFVSLSENLFVYMLYITSSLLAILARFSKRRMFQPDLHFPFCLLTFIAWVIHKTQIRKLDPGHNFSPFITEKNSFQKCFCSSRRWNKHFIFFTITIFVEHNIKSN